MSWEGDHRQAEVKLNLKFGKAEVSKQRVSNNPPPKKRKLHTKTHNDLILENMHNMIGRNGA